LGRTLAGRSSNVKTVVGPRSGARVGRDLVRKREGSDHEIGAGDYKWLEREGEEKTRG